MEISGRVWNKLLTSKNNLLLAVVKSERAIAEEGCRKCWWHEVREGLASWGMVELGAQLPALQAVDAGAVQDQVQIQVDAELHQFAGADLRSESNRPYKPKTAGYRVWFWQDWGRKLPSYFSMKDLTYEEIVSVARFRLGSHFLMVEKGRHLTPRITWAARKCTRCAQDRVDDELHMLFECERFHEQRQA